MKKLLLTVLFIWGLSAHAGMRTGENYINVQAGLNLINLVGFYTINFPEDVRFTLHYGMPFESDMGNSLGFAEIGFKVPTFLLSLKYGYEFMRDNFFSFGIDIALLFGIPTENYDSFSFDGGGELGVFVKMEITNNISGFIRGGFGKEVLLTTLLDTGAPKGYVFLPFVDLGIQYRL